MKVESFFFLFPFTTNDFGTNTSFHRAALECRPFVSWCADDEIGCGAWFALSASYMANVLVFFGFFDTLTLCAPFILLPNMLSEQIPHAFSKKED